jgi:hypothetical protein
MIAGEATIGVVMKIAIVMVGRASDKDGRATDKACPAA